MDFHAVSLCLYNTQLLPEYESIPDTCHVSWIACPKPPLVFHHQIYHCTSGRLTDRRQRQLHILAIPSQTSARPDRGLETDKQNGYACAQILKPVALVKEPTAIAADKGSETGTPTNRIEIFFRWSSLQPFHQPRRKYMSWRTRDILMGREADLKEMLDLHCWRVRSCQCFALAVLALTKRCVKIRKHNEPLIRTILCITMPESHIQRKP